MAKVYRKARWWMPACLVLGGGLVPVWGAATPTVNEMLAVKPKHDDVAISTPEPDKQSACKVEVVKNKSGKGKALVLKDANGQILRRFADSQDSGHTDVWSFYKDGVEVYRISREANNQFHYRWFNGAGMKWGIDVNRDGKIDQWKAISPEEASQEVLQALITKDFARFQALLITEAEIKALELPDDQAAALREKLKAAPAKFQETVGKLTGLSAKASWVHLELAAPQCLPADQLGGRADVLKHSRGTILYEVGGKTDSVQTGELILVGQAWRLVSAPTPGTAAPAQAAGGLDIDSNPKLAKLIEELSKLDKEQPQANSAELIDHHLSRATLVEKIVAEVKPEEREAWIRQIADSLSTAAGGNGKNAATGLARLQSLEKQLVKEFPATNLTAYVVFRGIQADYSGKIVKMTKPEDFKKVQQELAERLAKFVTAYPQADETPDSLLQLGQVHEYLDEEVKARNWYAAAKKNFADRPQAAKAAGAIRRLEAEGQPLRLAGPTLAEGNTTFDVDALHGKVVLIYYWASWNTNSVGDFAKLKALLEAYASKGLELVSINLDDTPQRAKEFLQRNPVPGAHLYQPGGMEGRLATDYGIMMTPHLFLVGKDGKVLNRNAQLGAVEEEVKKLLNK
jgi:thiol-disulfide isomerase/thioredoxin